MSNFLRNGVPRKENGKIDFSWKHHYGFTGLIILLGWFLPPLAVAVRFGIGKDFFINVLLTICGYIPGHLHNWFIQNVRNNDTKTRTPKWAIRYGLVDDRPAKKLIKSRAWTARYNDRVPQRVVYDDDGNAHVVTEQSDVPIRPQDTGLVEEDQWISNDSSSSFPRSSPSQTFAAPSNSKSSSRSKYKTPKFFKRNSAAADQRRVSITERNDAFITAQRQSMHRDRSSSSSFSGPEDASRQYGDPSRDNRRTNAMEPKSREQDVFAHEF